MSQFERWAEAELPKDTHLDDDTGRDEATNCFHGCQWGINLSSLLVLRLPKKYNLLDNKGTVDSASSDEDCAYSGPLLCPLFIHCRRRRLCWLRGVIDMSQLETRTHCYPWMLLRWMTTHMVSRDCVCKLTLGMRLIGGTLNGDPSTLIELFKWISLSLSS